MADVATGPQGGPGVSAFGDNRAAGWLPWEEPPAPRRDPVPHPPRVPHHLHLVEIRQTPPVDDPEPLPFVVRYFHAVCLTLVFIAVGLEWLMDKFGPQAPLDPIVHFIFPMASGSIIVSTLFWDDPPRPLPAMIMVGTIGVTLEVLWEIIEFTGDHLLNLHWQIDNTDTMWDLVIGVAGASFGAVTHAAVRLAEGTE